MAAKEMLALLRARKVKREDIISAVLELHKPHPGVETRQKARALLSSLLEEALGDANVNALLLAALRLEEAGEKGGIPGVSKKDFKDDAVFIVADEILGLAIAEYIGGTRARFEYVRFDKKKPGVLKKLGPFLDDAVCGVAAGISSRMYSEAGKK